MSENYTPPKSGDLCSLLYNATLVEHWKCDQYTNGTITDVRTGKVVTR